MFLHGWGNSLAGARNWATGGEVSKAVWLTQGSHSLVPPKSPTISPQSAFLATQLSFWAPIGLTMSSRATWVPQHAPVSLLLTLQGPGFPLMVPKLTLSCKAAQILVSKPARPGKANVRAWVCASDRVHSSKCCVPGCPTKEMCSGFGCPGGSGGPSGIYSKYISVWITRSNLGAQPLCMCLVNH